MLLVLIIAGALWTIGWRLSWPHTARWSLLGLLFVSILALHLVLPDGHPIREATGSDPALWLLLAGFTALIMAYRWVLVRLRARANPPAAASPALSDKLSETELERYARHIVLRELGGPGQMRLKRARVLVIGAGGLGAPALQYLAAAGVGTIGVIDDDVVENANLQRQVIHTDTRIGMAKVFSAQAAMTAQNPFVTVRPYHRRLAKDIAAELFADYDIVLDGTDNFETRYLVNQTAAKLGLPLISGALSQWEGQVSVFDPARGAPCYQCVFPDAPLPGLAPSCAEAGVLGPLPGVVGAMMATEAIKVITDTGAPLRGEMLIYDALWSETRKIGVRRRPDCPICGQDTKNRPQQES